MNHQSSLQSFQKSMLFPIKASILSKNISATQNYFSNRTSYNKMRSKQYQYKESPYVSQLIERIGACAIQGIFQLESSKVLGCKVLVFVLFYSVWWQSRCEHPPGVPPLLLMCFVCFFFWYKI